MVVARTKRLILREFELGDAEFIRKLVNDPDWLKNIGERNVHSIADAENFIQKLRQSYVDNGFGFYAVVETETSKTVGMCGLIKRAELEHVDLGFAFLPVARGKGYAQESSRSMVDYAQAKNLEHLLGIISPANTASQNVLEKVGMKFERQDKFQGKDILIYGLNL